MLSDMLRLFNNGLHALWGIHPPEVSAERIRNCADPRTAIPPQGLLPFRAKRARPYLYSDHEIRSLLSAALIPAMSDSVREPDPRLKVAYCGKSAFALGPESAGLISVSDKRTARPRGCGY